MGSSISVNKKSSGSRKDSEKVGNSDQIYGVFSAWEEIWYNRNLQPEGDPHGEGMKETRESQISRK